jgi:flavin-dependent dehydrogenase
MDSMNTDILIIGAGPVGAHAARLFGENGFDVVLVEKNARNACGAQWVNGVPLWQLDDAGLGAPHPQEIYHEGGSFSIVSPLGNSRITLHDAEMLDLDMRHFGLRLLQAAESQPNVRVFYETAFRSLEFDNTGRPVCASTTKGQIRFKLVIDASGLSAIVRKQVHTLTKLCPQVLPEDLCTAAQEVREISDVRGALNFLERNHSSKGEALAFVNVAGGFSLLRVHVDQDLQNVAFLSGARALPGIPSAKDLIRQFVQDNPWTGTMKFGGQRPIPLRRPYAALSASGIALLGDSGCQVYPAHASGIGVSLLAAKMLSDTLLAASTSGEDIGEARVLARYARAFHKKYGALLANSDISRRFSQDLTQEETHTLIDQKLLTTKMIRDSLFQKPVGLHVWDLPSQLAKAMRHPAIARRVLKVAAKVPAVAAMMLSYPRKNAHDPEKLLKFENRLEKLVAY